MIESLDKFEVSQKLEELKELLHDPEAAWYDFPDSLYEEIMNMPRDKDGGIPKYYLSDSLKSLLSLVDKIKEKEECKQCPIDDIITDDFFGTLFTKRYGRQ